MNMVHWLAECLKNPIRKPLPILSSPGIQLIGITVRELVLKGELQAKCMKAIADRYPTLASVSIMDLSVEAEAFGANATYYDREVPSISRRLIETGTDAENLQIPPIGAGRTGECVKAIELASRWITDRPIFAGVIGPFSLAGRLIFQVADLVSEITIQMNPVNSRRYYFRYDFCSSSANDF